MASHSTWKSGLRSRPGLNLGVKATVPALGCTAGTEGSVWRSTTAICATAAPPRMTAPSAPEVRGFLRELISTRAGGSREYKVHPTVSHHENCNFKTNLFSHQVIFNIALYSAFLQHGGAVLLFPTESRPSPFILSSKSLLKGHRDINLCPSTSQNQSLIATSLPNALPRLSLHHTIVLTSCSV